MVVRGLDLGMDDFIRVKFTYLCGFIAALPLFSMISCILLSVLLHWEEVTSTHCHVPNYLPSMSAAIGDFTPQRYIWRIGIAIHCFMRFSAPIFYYQFYKPAVAGKPKLFHRLVIGSCILHFLENWSLLTISYVSSNENYGVHEKAFICFMVFSMAYMSVTCLIFKMVGETDKNEKNHTSLRMKFWLMVFNMSIFALAVYFFLRHNSKCEPGVYSLFALCEYLVVLSNIGFHATIAWDMKDAYITIGPFSMLEITEKYR